MKLYGQILAGMAVFVAGCSTERYEGGFETSDLTARVLTPSGEPAAGARVWLVRSQGLVAPATVLDSAWTDSLGLARFNVSRSEDRWTLGLDGKMDDLMAISQTPLLHSDSARLSLAQTQSVTVGAGPGGETPVLFVPGSHFLSAENAAGRAVLTLPRGTWTIAKSLSGGTSLISSVFVGSLPLAFDTSSNAIDTNKAASMRDSVRFDGTTHYADSTFPLPIAWTRDTGVLDSCRLLPGMVSDDTGTFVLATGPTTIVKGIDSEKVSGGSRISSGRLPDSGTLAIRFVNPETYRNDSVLVRRMQLTDSLGGGVVALLSLGSDGGLPDSMLQAPLATKLGPIIGSWAEPHPLVAPTWYFSWTRNRILVRADTVLVGTIVSSEDFRGLRLRISATTSRPDRSSTIRLEGVRLYKPD